MKEIVQWLERQHRQIMDCERDAMAMLSRDDTAGYRAKMHEKAELLASLAKEAIPQLGALSNAEREYVENGLRQFSASASTALSLDSVFYMSALLYRDDHKKGEPDNLELFIQDLKQKLA